MKAFFFPQIQQHLILKHIIKHSKLKTVASKAIETAAFDPQKLQETLHAVQIVMLRQLLSPQTNFYGNLARAYSTRQLPAPRNKLQVRNTILMKTYSNTLTNIGPAQRKD